METFRRDPDCKVFLSTDAGGVGLNLQAASAVINFEPPWNPARLEQRIGRVHRMGQSQPVQAIHFLTSGSIEERVWETLRIKKSLFAGVFDSPTDEVSFAALGKKSVLQAIKEIFAEQGEAPTPVPPPQAVSAPAPVPPPQAVSAPPVPVSAAASWPPPIRPAAAATSEEHPAGGRGLIEAGITFECDPQGGPRASAEVGSPVARALSACSKRSAFEQPLQRSPGISCQERLAGALAGLLNNLASDPDTGAHTAVSWISPATE
jgi:hypothetical protein